MRSAKFLAISVGSEGWSTKDFTEFMQNGRVGQFQVVQALQVLVRAAELESVRFISHMTQRHLALRHGMHLSHTAMPVDLTERADLA